MKLTDALANLAARKQDAITAYPAKMGDGSGRVIAGAGLVYVRIADVVAIAACTSVPPIHDLEVWVGYENLQRNVLRVLGQRDALGNRQFAPGVAAHAAMHEFMGPGSLGGTDVVKVQLQQFMPLAIWPYDGLKVIVWPGVVWINGQYKLIADLNQYDKPVPQIIDFGEYAGPAANKEMYYLVGIDNAGNIQVVAGNQVDWGTLALTDIPSVPENMIYPLAAVRRSFEQLGIVINRESSDIVDLRFPLAHKHRGEDIASGTISANRLPLFTATEPGAVPAPGTVSNKVLRDDGTWVSAGSGDMTKAVYDTNNNGIVDAAESVPWSGITGKPSTFPPDAHTHLMTDITGGMATIRVQRSSNQSIPSATWTALSFDTIIYESAPGSESQWSSGSPTRLTCKLAGMYLVIAHVRFATNSVGARGINLLKNGNPMVANVVHTSSTEQIHLQVSEIMLLNVGDYVFTWVYQDSGGALDVISTSNNLYLEWIRLGP